MSAINFILSDAHRCESQQLMRKIFQRRIMYLFSLALNILSVQPANCVHFVTIMSIRRSCTDLNSVIVIPA